METRQADRVTCRDSRRGTSGIQVKTAEVGLGACIWGRETPLCLPCVTVIVPVCKTVKSGEGTGLMEKGLLVFWTGCV